MQKLRPRAIRSSNNANFVSGGGFKMPSSFGYFGSKVIVKNYFIKNNNKQVANHIKYIEHRQKEEKAELFDKEKDNVHRYSYHDNINLNIYQVHHKIVISPEDRLTREQLKDLAREVMLKLENYKQQDIVWIATVHDKEEHTKYPHLHVVASGKDSVLRLEKRELELIKKESSRYVSREIGLDKALKEKIGEEYTKEIATIDIHNLDKEKAEKLAISHKNDKIKELSGHTVIRTLDPFNDKKLQKIGSQLFISRDKNSYMWIENSAINILTKEKLTRDELLALKSEVISKIDNTRRSLFSGFKDNKTINLKDEILEQETIKYNRLKEERRELLSQNHSDPDKSILNKVAIESNLNQIKGQLKAIKNRYNTLTGVTDKSLHQLIKSSDEIKLSERLINNFAKREKEYALRNIEYAYYERHFKNNLIMKTYFLTKDKKIDKALEETVKMYKNKTGQGEERYILDPPLKPEISKKLASIDIESTARNVLKMRNENHFKDIRTLVLDITGNQDFRDSFPKDRNKILFETINQYLKEKNINLPSVVIRELVRDNSAIAKIKEMKGNMFLKEKKSKASRGYYLTLNEAKASFRRIEKDNPGIDKLIARDKRYIDNTYFSIRVSADKALNDNKETKHITILSTNVEHKVDKVKEYIKDELKDNGAIMLTYEINKENNKTPKYRISITTNAKLERDEVGSIKEEMRNIFYENHENRKFKDEKSKAFKDFSNAILDTKNIDNTPPIIEKTEPDRGSIDDKDLKTDNLDKQIIKFYEEDPIRIIEHISDNKMLTNRELSEYINGVNYLKNKDELNAEAAIITEYYATKDMRSEDNIKKKIEESHTEKLKDLGIKPTNISSDNLNKTLSEVKDNIMNYEYNTAIAPSKGQEKQIKIGIER